MTKKQKDNTWKIILSIVIGILILILVSSIFGKIDQGSYNSNNKQNVEYTTSISDVKIEFIPSSISRINCDAGKSCIINFQIKNIGEKRIYLSPGTFEDNADLSKITYFSVGSQNSAHLSPGEISQTLSVNAFSNTNLDEGDYQIKIPMQVYGESGARIGESNYYLTGVVHYSNLPYCCSEQQVKKGYCDKVASDNCRSLSCEETNNLPPCYDDN